MELCSTNYMQKYAGKEIHPY